MEDVIFAKIVDVDEIWGANSLKEALSEDAVLDYVIASHVRSMCQTS
jgi:hypothetical protein